MVPMDEGYKLRCSAQGRAFVPEDLSAGAQNVPDKRECRDQQQAQDDAVPDPVHRKEQPKAAAIKTLPMTPSAPRDQRLATELRKPDQ